MGVAEPGEFHDRWKSDEPALVQLEQPELAETRDGLVVAAVESPAGCNASGAGAVDRAEDLRSEESSGDFLQAVGEGSSRKGIHQEEDDQVVHLAGEVLMIDHCPWLAGCT